MDSQVVKPFHLFTYKDNQYVINIENMLASSIDEQTFSEFEKLSFYPEIPLTDRSEEKLNSLYLLSDKETQAKLIDRNRKKLKPVNVSNIILFLTQSCKLRCIYCYGQYGSYGIGGDMDEQTAFQAVNWILKKSGNKEKVAISFMGGEPFHKFSLMQKIVDYSLKQFSAINIEVVFNATTNGTLLDEEKIAFIKQHNINMLVSIDGPKQIHDAQRPMANGQGSYELIVNNVKRLLEVMPNVHGHAVLMNGTDPRIIKKALLDIGFKESSVTLASSSLFDSQEKKITNQRDIKFFLEMLEQEAEAWLECVYNRDQDGLKQIIRQSELSVAIEILINNRKRFTPCGAGLGLVGISCVGDAYLCHRFVGQEEYKIGSVFGSKLDRDIYHYPVSCNENCSDCFARFFCAGGCKHDNLSMTGSIFTASQDFCRLKQRILELAAYVVSNLSQEGKEFLIDKEILPPKFCPLDF